MEKIQFLWGGDVINQLKVNNWCQLHTYLECWNSYPERLLLSWT